MSQGPKLGRLGARPLGYNQEVPSSPEAQRLRTALELFEAGVRLMESRLRRLYPDASPAEIETRLRTWLLERPGAPHGDAVGRSVPWGRPS